MKEWQYQNIFHRSNPDRFYIRYFSRRFHLDHILMNYLYSQGYNTLREIQDYLHPSMEQLHDPFMLRDMKRAIQRIINAVKLQEKIVIFGDYDCDGQTSTALLYRALTSIGANIDFQIPLRSEGYGLKRSALEKIKPGEVSLIITVDNGTSAHDAMAKAKEMGIDVIVTDHHEILRGYPACYAFINPKREDQDYPFSHLAGVGVALKVVQALFMTICKEDGWKRHLIGFLDFAAIGTVADMMPLVGENRTIVALGIKVLNQQPKPIFKKILKKLPDKYVTSSTIGFGFGPLLNACGRIADPNISTHYLCNGDLSTDELLELIQINAQRKRMTEEQFDLAEVIIQDHHLDEYNIVVVQGPFHEGIIGLLASRISEKYLKPAIVLNENGKGSCRSVQGTDFSIIKALEMCNGYLEQFGGHKAAAGLTIPSSKIDDFRRAIHLAAQHQERVIPKVYFQNKLPIYQFPDKLIEEFQRLEPFGIGNPKPHFYSESWFDRCRPLGKSNEHYLLSVANRNIWAFRYRGVSLKPKKKIQFLYTINSTDKHDFLLVDAK